MRLRARFMRMARNRALMTGLPSDCLFSSFTSCFDMRMDRMKEKR